MRAIVQRVSSASVTVGAEVVSRIGEGLMVLVGLGIDDTPRDIEIITQKVLNVKAFEDTTYGGQWKSSVMARKGEVLCVSQFTLYAQLNKAKPDFHKSMPAESSAAMYASFLERMGEVYDPAKIKDGKFGAMMSVALTNEGPVTFILDSQPEIPDANASSGSQKPGSGKVTPRGSSVVEAQSSATAQRAAEKALRKAAWEAARKQGKEDAPVDTDPSKDADGVP